ncbi:MAG: hypothetical protein AB8B49_03500 [Nitratireductor sp.]
MTKKIRNQIISMSVVLGLLLILGAWQFDFVITAIYANVFLNATIFGTFFFGVCVAYVNVFSLKNEVVAFNALREDHEDATSHAIQDASDPYWRYYRCDEEAVIFSRPQIIEQPYQIISEEIARTGTLSLNTGVMQNLMDSVADRIDEKKSLVQYVTGILVFLGLIGTFVGLMVTLGSVGDIIGGLDLSGGGGAEAIQGLMNDLQIPLQGMATGFSSSLFGLITSLSLGLMARFANRSSNIFRMHFETWLASLAVVDADSEQGGGSGALQEREISLMLRVARLSLVSNTKLASSVEALSQSTEKVFEAQIESDKTSQTIAEAVKSLAETQFNSHTAITDMASILETREELAGMIESLRVDTEKQAQTYVQVNDAIDKVVDRQEELHEFAHKQQEQFVLRDELIKIVDGVDERLVGEFSNMNNIVHGVESTLNQLDNSLDRGTAEFQVKQDGLVEQFRFMQDELLLAVTKSKVAIEKADAARAAKEADDLEKEKSEFSLNDLQKLLHENFDHASQSNASDKAPDSENAPAEETTKKRKGFGFFRRSA